jgi:uncharacterized membrane protein
VNHIRIQEGMFYEFLPNVRSRFCRWRWDTLPGHRSYKTDRFVRFHAFQAIFFNVAWIALWIAWTMIGPVLGAVTKGLFFILQVPIDLALMVGGFALWVFLMYSAYQGKTTRLPVIGALAEPLLLSLRQIPVLG